MSDKQNDKYPFKSPTTAGLYCTPAQYIAELVCIRTATKQHITLSGKFWEDDGWKTTYKQQILGANQLLKLFEPQAIINAFNLKECKWMSSLWVKALKPFIIRESERLEAEKLRLVKEQAKYIEQQIEEQKHISSPEIVAKPFSTNKPKLRNLD